MDFMVIIFWLSAIPVVVTVVSMLVDMFDYFKEIWTWKSKE